MFILYKNNIASNIKMYECALYGVATYNILLFTLLMKNIPCSVYLGRELKKFRLLKSLSQEEVANLADIGLSYYGRVERGQINVSFASLVKILQVLDIQFAELVPNIYDIYVDNKDLS